MDTNADASDSAIGKLRKKKKTKKKKRGKRDIYLTG